MLALPIRERRMGYAYLVAEDLVEVAVHHDAVPVREGHEVIPEAGSLEGIADDHDSVTLLRRSPRPPLENSH